MGLPAADPRHALVLFSGGQDSTVCLAWALDRFARVETIGFDYGQRHAIELTCRVDVLERLRAAYPDWAARLGDDHLLDLSLLGRISDTALTDARAIELQANGLPNTFVPGRNLLFLTFAAALAYRRSVSVLVGGMCETDFSGYPDCRHATLAALQVALSRGLEVAMAVETPLMWLTKAQTWALAYALGGAPLTGLIVEHTHSCYLGDRSRRHGWGYGCGACPACELRRRGFDEWSAGVGAGPEIDADAEAGTGSGLGPVAAAAAAEPGAGAGPGPGLGADAAAAAVERAAEPGAEPHRR